MDVRKWKSIKRSGGYRRKVSKVFKNIQRIRNDNECVGQVITDSIATSENVSPRLLNLREGSVDNSTCNGDSVLEERYNLPSTESNYEQGPEYLEELENICFFRNQIRNLALKHNLSHAALKDLLKILNERSPNSMPKDPRTLLHTPRAITTTIVEPGEYWHNNIELGIVRNLEKTTEIPEQISILVNIDGLPIYKSSKLQFWPILCSIFEKPDISPIICGIYLGSTKPKDLNAFLKQFLDEICDVLKNGIKVRNKEVHVTMKCFVCDSPARALVKGVCNFNGKHGCLKCTVIGEYSHVSHTVVFPGIDCPLRNDKDFRERKYGNHHKIDSPLLKLPIDMVEAFPVADSLHLIDLGVVKRLLIGWRDGNFGKKITKWRANDIQAVNAFLNSCKTPTEIHRAVRKLDSLSHWKGSEYRTFFHYFSVTILPKVLKQEALQHFHTLFCAITICSNEDHFHLLYLAGELLKYFTKHYKDFYGIDYVTSNVHNLIHVVDEVRRFGKLENFNAYKFENKLNLIKNMLRQGNKPLAQVASRLREYENIHSEQNVNRSTISYPYTKENLKKHNLILHLKDFVLSTKKADKYFLTFKKEVMEVVCVDEVQENRIKIYCKKFEHLQNIFDLPIKSSYLNIFKSKDNLNLRSDCVCSPCDVKCKLVVSSYESELYFIPLLHTL